MTTKPTIRWGIWGATVFLAAYAVVFALRVLFPASEQMHSVFRVMVAPVLFLWDALVFRGDAGDISIPIVISMFMFPVLIGFGFGTLAHWIFGSR